MQSIFRSVWAAMLQSLRRLVVLLLHVHVGATCHPKHIYMRYVADRFKKLTMVRTNCFSTDGEDSHWRLGFTWMCWGTAIG